MEDKAIIDLYWERSEDAISQTKEKYGKYCFVIANNILCCEQDAEECVNDTYVKAWESMPPKRPAFLSAFLGKITRNLSLNRYYYDRAMKRSPEIELALDELGEVLSADAEADPVGEETALKDVINRYLASLPKNDRVIFVRRYWFMSSVREISDMMGMTENNVKVKLSRLRQGFKAFLNKEGIQI